MTDETSGIQPAEATNDGSVRRPRGAGFPVLPLPKAITAVKELGKTGKQHSMAALAEQLGHETTNSGPFRGKVAALRDWGLISGSGDLVVLTDLGWTLAHPPDDESEVEATQEAFSKPAIISQMYSELPKGVNQSIEKLANRAVQLYQVAAGSKNKFAGSLVDSAVAAGLAEKPNPKEVCFIETDSGEGEPPEGQEDNADQGHDGSAGSDPGDAAGSGESPQTGGSAPVVLRQAWPTVHGEVIIEVRSTAPLTASAFTQVGKLVTEAEQLADLLSDDD